MVAEKARPPDVDSQDSVAAKDSYCVEQVICCCELAVYLEDGGQILLLLVEMIALVRKVREIRHLHCAVFVLFLEQQYHHRHVLLCSGSGQSE